jgi:hypothetical protein
MLADRRLAHLKDTVGKKELKRRIEKLLLTGHDDRAIEIFRTIFFHKAPGVITAFSWSGFPDNLDRNSIKNFVLLVSLYRFRRS